MKKTILPALALMGATLGVGAVPQNANIGNQQTESKTQKHNEAVGGQLVAVRRQKITALNPAGLSTIIYQNYGTSPKEYGQWLQFTGRQKWVKRKK